jgi:hypothetical protein
VRNRWTEYDSCGYPASKEEVMPPDRREPAPSRRSDGQTRSEAEPPPVVGAGEPMKEPDTCEHGTPLDELMNDAAARIPMGPAPGPEEVVKAGLRAARAQAFEEAAGIVAVQPEPPAQWRRVANALRERAARAREGR